MLVKRTATIFVVLLFSSLLPAENQEKAQKKVLEANAKAIIAEAKTLEKSGQLVEARVKYAESQAMLETRDAVDAIKHLDDEIHKHAKDVLNESRKLYEAHKYKEAAVALEQGAKIGTSQGVLSFNLALSYFQLGERNKAVESLDTAIRDTPDPKEKARFEQLLTSFTTGENAAAANDNDRNRVAQFNHLADSLGFDASLEDDEGTTEDRPFSESDLPSPQLTEATLKSNSARPPGSHSIAHHKSGMCIALQEIKTGAVTPPSIIFDRANCAEINGRPAEAVRLLQQYLEAAPHALDADGVQPRVAELQSLIALPEPHGIEIRRLYASASGYLTERKYDRALAALLKAKSLVAEFSLTYWKVALLYEAMDNLDLARENFTHYAQLTSDPTAKEAATLHLSRLEEKKSRYEEEVSAAEDILSDLFNRGMNLTFNLDESRSSIRAHRARIKKKQDQKKDKNRIGGFAIPYAYAQQELGRASEHLQVALALFPLGPEANELMGLVFLQANDGRAAIKNFDAVASQGLPVAFYAEMRGHKLDHAVKCELARDQVRLIFLSTYDKKGNPTAPDKPAGDDGLGDLTLAPSDDRAAVDSLNLSLADIHKVETNKGLLTFKLAKQEFTLAPIYLPSYTPVEGPPARRFANNYTRLFIRYPGLEDAKLGAEGMTGGEKFVMGYKLASAGLNIATSLNPIGAIQATQSAISIARIIHSAMASMNVSFASWERSVDDQQQLLAGPSFKAIPIEPMNLAFVHDLK
jgi:tetratricopeptide (TPR) repeat protein